MKILERLFQEGNRKMLMSLLAIAVTVLTEKYTGPLSGQALEAIVYIVGIFAGANAAEHFAQALKLKHGGPLPLQEELPLDPAPAPTSSGVTVDQVLGYAQQIAKDSSVKFQALENQSKSMQELLNKQSMSIQGLTNVINASRKQPPQEM